MLIKGHKHVLDWFQDVSRDPEYQNEEILIFEEGEEAEEKVEVPESGHFDPNVNMEWSPEDERIAEPVLLRKGVPVPAEIRDWRPKPEGDWEQTADLGWDIPDGGWGKWPVTKTGKNDDQNKVDVDPQKEDSESDGSQNLTTALQREV